MLGFYSLTGYFSGVAFWAHIGGFAAGLLIVITIRIKSKLPNKSWRTRKPIKPIIVNPKVKTPFVDVIEEEEKVRIIAELPGVQINDVDIQLSEMRVVITANHEKNKYYRLLLLRARVEPNIQNLQFRNGVLSFSLNKKR